VDSDLLTHHVYILLGLIYHVQGTFPLLLELVLSLLNVLHLDLDPLFELLLALCVSPRGELACLEHLLDVLAFLFEAVVKGFLSHLYQVEELVVIDHVLELGGCIFLEGVTLKERGVRGLGRVGMLLHHF
jgi:hypothetical protein